ncbi:alpha/beta fold hydrolase [Opitutia bacterium ISCC 51]|nr:alpha/beta fold hydrolase [Opitutae bacterium ISCC 51]QXD30257.1 alpha/beta fold hydrolase [Opitutae bacterium ISCC 52]
MIDTIKNKEGEGLDFEFSKGDHDSEQSEWIAVLGHGVTGNKDRPIVADTADALNKAGIDTLRFSFSGNGDSEGRFVDSNISKEVEDLAVALNAVSGSYSKVCYLGHSMGAAVGVIRAAEDKRINALVSMAGMVDTKAFAQTEFGEEVPDAGLMWEETDCPLSSLFMNDLCTTVGNVESWICKVEVPWLLVHGTGDDVVLPQDSETVKRLKGDSVDLLSVEGADHSFNEPSHKAALLEAVVSWLRSLA